MNIRLGNADLVLILALALGGAILLAMRFRPQALARPRVQALLANLAAVAAVVTVEALLA